jgi:hypothetical protein
LGLQPATPEVESLPFQSIVTVAVYHPFAFAWRSGVAVTLGAVASYFSRNGTDAD